jgi:hypothetical protein
MNYIATALAATLAAQRAHALLELAPRDLQVRVHRGAADSRGHELFADLQLELEAGELGNCAH